MRKTIIVAVLVLTGLSLVAIVNVNFLVQRNKDFLLGKLSAALGRQVSADTIAVSFLPLGARLTDLAVADDPAFSSGAIASAKLAAIELRLLPLLSGEFRPSKLMLDSPVITLIRHADGRYNYQLQAKPKQRDKAHAAGGGRSADAPPLPVVPNLQVTDGTLRYGELAITQIQLTVSDFSEDRAMEIALAAAVTADKANLKFKSKIGPIAGIADYRDYPIDGSLDAQQLDLGKVNRAVPQLRKALPRHLRFDGVYDIKNLRFKGTLNRPSLKGAVSGTDASFRFD